MVLNVKESLIFWYVLPASYLFLTGASSSLKGDLGTERFLEASEPGFLIGGSLKNSGSGDLHFAIQLEYYWNVFFSCLLPASVL